MCIVICAPKGTDKYSKEFVKSIRYGLIGNADGAGFAVKFNQKNNTNNGKIWFRKGYMKHEDTDLLIQDIKDLQLEPEDELIVHGRIATKGEVDETNCHPFPLSSDELDLWAVEGWADHPIVAHNGNFKGYGTKLYSDTFMFVKEVLSNPWIQELLINDPKGFGLIFKETLGWSKMAFLFQNRDMVLYGDFVEDKGYFYSNFGYKNHTEYENVGTETMTAEEYEEYMGCPFTPSLIGFNSSRNMPKKQLSLLSAFKPAIKVDIPIIRTKSDNLILNDIVHEITWRNWNHFYLIARDEKYHSVKKGDKLEFKEIIKGFEGDTETLWFRKVDEEGTSSWCGNTKCLYQHFDIVPKEQYKEIYEDVLVLTKKKNCSKTQIRALRTAIEYADNKKEDIITLKGIGHNLSKEAGEIILVNWMEKLYA